MATAIKLFGVRRFITKSHGVPEFVLDDFCYGERVVALSLAEKADPPLGTPTLLMSMVIAAGLIIALHIPCVINGVYAVWAGRPLADPGWTVIIAGFEPLAGAKKMPRAVGVAFQLLNACVTAPLSVLLNEELML